MRHQFLRAAAGNGGGGPAGLLLDDYPGAAAAYSLRQLRTGVTNVVRVRRSDDDTEADFTAAEVTDGTLTGWVGAGNDGFVTSWFDQSGNGRSAVQNTANFQPQIVSSGALWPGGVNFNGSSHQLALSQPFSGTTGRSLFCVSNADTIANNESIFALYQGSLTNVGTVWNFTPETAVRVSGNVEWTSFPLTAPSVSSLHLPTGGVINDHSFFLNGVERAANSSASGTAAINTNSSPSSVVGVNSNLNTFYDGSLAELILYGSHKSADRVGIESNMNAHHAIF